MKAIFIVAGHGMAADGVTDDNGASIGNKVEYEQVSEIVRELSRFISTDPDLNAYKVIYLGADERLSLKEKVKQINKTCRDNGWGTNDAMVVELHCNTASDPEARGIEAFISDTKQQVDALAQALCTQLMRSTDIPLRKPPVKLSSQNRHGRLAICDDTNCQAVLLEVCFLSNKKDSSIIMDPVADDDFSRGIVNGLRIGLGYSRFPDGKDPKEYTDVREEAWYAKSVKRGVAAKIFTVGSDRLFRPDQSPTRAELAAVCERLMDHFQTELEKLEEELLQKMKKDT